MLCCSGSKTGVSTWLRGVQRDNLDPVVGEASVRTLSKTEVCVPRRWVEKGVSRQRKKVELSVEQPGTPGDTCWQRWSLRWG